MSANVHATYILKRPVLSEKSTYAMNERKQYTFEVDVRASKPEIKAAVESLYKVRVESVNTSIRKHRARRMKFGVVQPAPVKKAFIRLHADDSIDLF